MRNILEGNNSVFIGSRLYRHRRQRERITACRIIKQGELCTGQLETFVLRADLVELEVIRFRFRSQRQVEGDLKV